MDHTEGPSTRSVHPSTRADPATGSVAAPIEERLAFAYPDLETWRAVAVKQAQCHIYSRSSSPTTRLLEEKGAALEGATRATSLPTGKVVNLGQVETLVGSPAVTSPMACTEEEIAEAGNPARAGPLFSRNQGPRRSEGRPGTGGRNATIGTMAPWTPV